MPLRTSPYRLSLIAALAATAATSAQAEEQSQVWLNLAASKPLSETFTLLGDASFRSRDELDGLRQVRVAGTASYTVMSDVQIGLGYSHFFNRSVGRLNTDVSVPFGQVSWRIGRVGPGVLSTRTRLELRSRSNDPDTSYRLRPQVSYVLPLGAKLPTLDLLAEGFFELDDTAGGLRSGYAQSRYLASVSLPVGEGLAVQPGYLLDTVRVRNGPDVAAHVLNLTLAARF